MDFKTAIKLLGMLAAFLVVLASFIIAGSACISYGKTIGAGILSVPGILCIFLGSGATLFAGYKLVKKGKL